MPLIAGLGVAGAGVALATQGVLSNMVAGLTIIFTKPYRVGEYIAVVGVEGEVEAITLFSTTLRHTDHSQIVVPNRKVVGEILQNFGSIRQCEIQVGIAYQSDLSAVLGIIRELVEVNARVLKDPKLVARFAEIGGVPQPMTPEQYGKYIAAETEKWRKVVEFAGVSVD